MTQIDFQPLDNSQQQIDFQPIDQSPPQQGVLGAVGAALSSRPELQPYGTGQTNQPSTVVGSALQAAGQTLAAPIRTGETLAQGPEAIGQAASDIGLATGYPKTGAVVGTAISMAPYVAGAVGGWDAIHASDNPIVKGLVNTPKELGPQYGALDTKAGVGSDLPVQRGTVPKFPGLDGTPQNQPPPQAPNVSPAVYPKDTKTYLNFVRNRLDSIGKDMTPQELSDHHDLLDEIMSNMKAKGQSGTKIFSKAAQAGSDISDIRNANVPGRSDLNKAYGISTTQSKIGPALKHYGATVAKVGGAIGGLGTGAYEIYRRLSGQNQ